MRKCGQCGKSMNPAESMLGPVCGKCCRDNQAAVTGQQPSNRKSRNRR